MKKENINESYKEIINEYYKKINNEFKNIEKVFHFMHGLKDGYKFNTYLYPDYKEVILYSRYGDYFITQEGMDFKHFKFMYNDNVYRLSIHHDGDDYQKDPEILKFKCKNETSKKDILLSEFYETLKEFIYNDISGILHFNKDYFIKIFNMDYNELEKELKK